jgi:hypothetical protein
MSEIMIFQNETIIDIKYPLYQQIRDQLLFQIRPKLGLIQENGTDFFSLVL